MVECRLCKTDTRKRVVLKRKSIRDITDQNTHPEIKKEFICKNTIKSLRPNGRDSEGKLTRDWCEETCDNHMIIQIFNKK